MLLVGGGRVTDLFELLVLVNAVVDFLLLVEGSLVIGAKPEDDSNFDEYDEDDEVVLVELEFIDSELVDFFLFCDVTVVIRVEEDEDDNGFDEGEASAELDVLESESLNC